MKKYILLIILLLFNSFRPMLTMELEETHYNVVQTSDIAISNINLLNLPQELLLEIVVYATFNLNIKPNTTSLQSIYNDLKSKRNVFIKIIFTCKKLYEFETQFTQFYKPYLKNLLIEKNHQYYNFTDLLWPSPIDSYITIQNKGLYPSNGMWIEDDNYACLPNQAIAEFFFTAEIDEANQCPILNNILTHAYWEEQTDNSHYQLVFVLIFYGANGNLSPSKKEWGSLGIAAAQGSESVVKLLLSQRINPQSYDNKYDALIAASLNKRLSILKLLLNGHTHKNFKIKRSKKDILLIHLMSFINNSTNHREILDIAQLLLDCNANINSQEHHSSTPLINAVLINNPEMVKLLLVHGANADAQDHKGNTALISAAFKGSIEIIKLLLAIGAKINIQNNNGDTALIEAASNGDTKTVKLLLSIPRIDIDLKNIEQQTAHDIALSKGYIFTSTVIVMAQLTRYIGKIIFN